MRTWSYYAEDALYGRVAATAEIVRNDHTAFGGIISFDDSHWIQAPL